ncbi:unnamed protein product [Peniophora sp. CBMAI 1063]|nr:unnamed protein product [Peniophora sp. CBMAI 1063]
MTINKPTQLLDLLLKDWKYTRPEIFRSYLRVTPACFDDLVKAIKGHAVFHNNSNNKQADVDIQLAVALYRLGHYGNATSTMKVALQFGIGYGSVQNYTDRVLAAINDKAFKSSALQWARKVVPRHRAVDRERSLLLPSPRS